MLDMTKVYFLISVRMTLTFTRDHRVTRKLELHNYSTVNRYEKFSGMKQQSLVVDYVREMTAKKSCA